MHHHTVLIRSPLEILEGMGLILIDSLNLCKNEILLFFRFSSGTRPSYLTDLLSPMLVRVIRARINTCKERRPTVTWIWTQVGPHGCKPSAFITELPHCPSLSSGLMYPQLNDQFKDWIWKFYNFLAWGQESSVGENLDLQSKNCRFEPHCRRGVFLV